MTRTGDRRRQAVVVEPAALGSHDTVETVHENFDGLGKMRVLVPFGLFALLHEF